MQVSLGHYILGVADTLQSANQFKNVYSTDYKRYSNFYITGVDQEASRHHGDVDSYFTKLTQLVKNEPISERDKDYISRNISSVKYFDKTVVILRLEAGSKPSIYDKKYFVRHGSNIEEIAPENFSELFDRFLTA